MAQQNIFNFMLKRAFILRGPFLTLRKNRTPQYKTQKRRFESFKSAFFVKKGIYTEGSFQLFLNAEINLLNRRSTKRLSSEMISAEPNICWSKVNVLP
jgi:hypothetical protein